MTPAMERASTAPSDAEQGREPGRVEEQLEAVPAGGSPFTRGVLTEARASTRTSRLVRHLRPGSSPRPGIDNWPRPGRGEKRTLFQTTGDTGRREEDPRSAWSARTGDADVVLMVAQRQVR